MNSGDTQGKFLMLNKKHKVYALNCSAGVNRDRFREHGALGHLSFWDLTQVWPM